jgi:hypothetical protein
MHGIANADSIEATTARIANTLFMLFIVCGALFWEPLLFGERQSVNGNVWFSKAGHMPTLRSMDSQQV